MVDQREQVEREVFIPGGDGRAIEVNAGEYLSVVAVSACPFDMGPLNGGKITPIQLVVTRSLPEA